jgi:hypothetical protein
MKKNVLIILIFLILIFLVLYLLRKQIINFIESYQDNISNIPIDFVYTWVDSYDPERNHYQKILLGKNDFNLDPSRYEQSDELKYSIRSIEENCPWYRKIYIVVKDGQKPDFIDFEKNKKIVLVNHSEIMPKSALPTFNSLAIETCLHKIKGLSDFYIYMNDDLFITKPLNIDSFLSTKNNIEYVPLVNIVQGENPPKINMENINNYDFGTMYLLSMNFANKITGQNMAVCPSHTPSVCYKPWDIELEKILLQHNLWDYTVHSKFRKNDNSAINNCIRPIFYIYKGADKIDYFKDTKLVNLEKKCSFDIPDNIKFLCVNKISDECKQTFQYIISNKFPNKSSYEK